MMQWAFAAVLALSASASGAEPPAPEEIMAVPPELRAQLHDRVTAEGGNERQRFERLLEFVLGDHGLALTHGAETTQTAAQTWRDGKVNCLSFSLLFVALAREAGLHADVQEIDEVLVWYKQDGFVYNTSHVNVGVRIDGRVRTVEVSTAPVIARHGPKVVPDRHALALFYNNRGAELLAAGEIDSAYRHMQASLDLDPDFASSWNNLGVLHTRNEDLRAAENAYLTALDLDPKHGPTLFNIVGLYRRLGDQERLDTYQRRLEKAQLADPFHQFLLAMESEKRGDYPRAVLHYKRAIRLHRHEELFHFGLARTYFAMGETRRGNRSLARAHEIEKANLHEMRQAELPGADGGANQARNAPVVASER